MDYGDKGTDLLVEAAASDKVRILREQEQPRMILRRGRRRIDIWRPGGME